MGSQRSAAGRRIAAAHCIAQGVQKATVRESARLSDIVGRRAVLYMTLFGGALGAAGQGLANSFIVLAASRAVSGACAAVGSTANVYVSDITTEDFCP